jgi:ABC-type multidrug transport system ATPase subunit
MSGGNQQKAIVGRELDRRTPLLIACQPTRGLDVGAIEYIHNQIVKARDEDKGVLLLSLELEEVMNLSDRILVMYEGEIVADLNPKEITLQELGLYMSGAKRMELPSLPSVENSLVAGKTVLDDAVAAEKEASIVEKKEPEAENAKEVPETPEPKQEEVKIESDAQKEIVKENTSKKAPKKTPRKVTKKGGKDHE